MEVKIGAGEWGWVCAGCVRWWHTAYTSVSLVSQELRAPLLPCGLLLCVCFCENITPDNERGRLQRCGCVSRCAIVKIILPSREASWELHSASVTLLRVFALPLQRCSPLFFFFGWGFSSSLIVFLSRLFMLLSVFACALDSPLRLSCVW